MRVVQADGCQGLAEQAPYHGIIVAAAASFIPVPLRAQLGDGGRLVIVTRQGDMFTEEITMPCQFVPLLGAEVE